MENKKSRSIHMRTRSFKAIPCSLCQTNSTKSSCPAANICPVVEQMQLSSVAQNSKLPLDKRRYAYQIENVTDLSITLNVVHPTKFNPAAWTTTKTTPENVPIRRSIGFSCRTFDANSSSSKSLKTIRRFSSTMKLPEAEVKSVKLTAYFKKRKQLRKKYYKMISEVKAEEVIEMEHVLANNENPENIQDRDEIAALAKIERLNSIKTEYDYTIKMLRMQFVMEQDELLRQCNSTSIAST